MSREQLAKLRYSDKKGPFPDVARNEGGMRVYAEDDLEWARFIERLKVLGMPISEIKDYIDLHREGGSTIEQRRKIVIERLRSKLVACSKGRQRSTISP